MGKNVVITYNYIRRGGENRYNLIYKFWFIYFMYLVTVME